MELFNFSKAERLNTRSSKPARFSVLKHRPSKFGLKTEQAQEKLPRFFFVILPESALRGRHTWSPAPKHSRWSVLFIE